MTTARWAAEALAGAKAAVFWSDRADAPAATPKLSGEISADLVVVGAGLTGLWTAIQALEDGPGLSVVILEAERCGFGASSRNGGFCDGSLTHGLKNGMNHWPDEVGDLVRMGRENLDGTEESIDRYGINADFRRAPEISVATQEWHLESFGEAIGDHRAVGDDVEIIDSATMKERVHSPTYLGGLIRRNDIALVDPARLCWGLRAAAESLGARLYEHSPATRVESERSALVVVTPNGRVKAGRVVAATNAYRGPTKQQSRYMIPVYDHVLMTEPLDRGQLASVGWEEREGLGDASNQFHYYRMSEDDRILWGGYDATYHFGSDLDPSHDQSEETHGKLAQHFFETFPQLEGLRFTHRWGGPVATTSHFAPAWGSTHQGRLVWVGGYTGLGVGSSRFGAKVALDLVFGRSTERTELEIVSKKPFPFPPEPFRWAGVQMTRKAIQRSDDHGGRRGPWLSLLDRFGVGFDS